MIAGISMFQPSGGGGVHHHHTISSSALDPHTSAAASAAGTVLSEQPPGVSAPSLSSSSSNGGTNNSGIAAPTIPNASAAASPLFPPPTSYEATTTTTNDSSGASLHHQRMPPPQSGIVDPAYLHQQQYQPYHPYPGASSTSPYDASSLSSTPLLSTTTTSNATPTTTPLLQQQEQTSSSSSRILGEHNNDGATAGAFVVPSSSYASLGVGGSAFQAQHQPSSQQHQNATPTTTTMRNLESQQPPPLMIDDSENNDTVATADYAAAAEGEESEEEPVKLFVGQIPKAMNEEDIFPTFDVFGPLKDVAVIRDKHSGMHRGCAFVTYWSAADAERARTELHDAFTFPGAKRLAQVKLAEPSTALESKLFVGMLSPECDEHHVYDLFSQFGEILEVYMIRNPDGSSKCAAFLRYAARESALAAMEQLNGIEVMDGVQRPLIVKLADNKVQRQQRHVRNYNRHNSNNHVRSRHEEMMTATPSMMGSGPHGGYNPYTNQHHHHHHPGLSAMTAMGMHQYPMATPNAQQVYDSDGNASQYGSQGPAHHLHHQQPHNPYMYAAAYGQMPPPYAAAAAAAYQQQQQQQHARPDARPAANPRPREGPAGANLFVYHLPHDLTDADLATAFNPFGNVISAKVFVDKFTGESKGFGFVSYDSVLAAEQAIEQMNGFQIGNKRLKVQHKRVHGESFNKSPQLDSQSSSENNSTNGGGLEHQLPPAAAG